MVWYGVVGGGIVWYGHMHAAGNDLGTLSSSFHHFHIHTVFGPAQDSSAQACIPLGKKEVVSGWEGSTESRTLWAKTTGICVRESRLPTHTYTRTLLSFLCYPEHF